MHDINSKLVRQIRTRLTDHEGTCRICTNLANCFGQYKAEDSPGLCCGDCCQHDNEDGWCVPIVEAEKFERGQEDGQTGDPPSELSDNYMRGFKEGRKNKAHRDRARGRR